MKAKFIKSLGGSFRGDARLYKVSHPVSYEGSHPNYEKLITIKTKYVVVSASMVPFSGPETYIFPSNEKGEVMDWSELNGSFRGGLDHVQALTDAGYEVEA